MEFIVNFVPFNVCWAAFECHQLLAQASYICQHDTSDSHFRLPLTLPTVLQKASQLGKLTLHNSFLANIVNVTLIDYLAANLTWKTFANGLTLAYKH